MEEAEKAIQELTLEAKGNLLKVLGIKTKESNGMVERAVDCIIMASALTVAKWQSEPLSK